MPWPSLSPFLTLLRLIGVCALVWALVPLCGAQAQPLEEDRRRLSLEDRLERVRAETAAGRERARRIAAELIDLDGDESQLRARLNQVAGRISTLEAGIAADEAALATLTARQGELRQSLAMRRQQVAELFGALQRIGRRPPPALAQPDEGILPVVRSAILLNAAVPELSAQARQLSRELTETNRLAREEEERWASLRRDLSDVEDERAALQGLVDALDRRRTLTEFERGQVDAELARLAQEAATVASLLQELEVSGILPSEAERARSGPPFDLLRSQLPAPVAGELVASFGEATATGTTKGRTIASVHEATVFAPAAGTVLFAGPFRSFGTILILDMGDGYHLVLAGLSQPLVRVGDAVAAGSPVGRMGKTPERAALAAAGINGAVRLGDRPALYVELRKDGTVIDTEGWFAPQPGQRRTSG